MEEIYFSIEKFTYTNQNSDFDLDFLPKLLKRRLNTTDKNTVFLLNKAFDESVESIVYSSECEFEKLNKIIQEYKEQNEVSPNKFSSLVHNFSVGFFLIFKKSTIPATAISAGENSFACGLLSSLLNDKNNTLYCFMSDKFGVSFKINKNKHKFKLTKKNIDKPQNKNNFFEFIDFIEKNRSKIELLNFEIERIQND